MLRRGLLIDGRLRGRWVLRVADGGWHGSAGNALHHLRNVLGRLRRGWRVGEGGRLPDVCCLLKRLLGMLEVLMHGLQGIEQVRQLLGHSPYEPGVVHFPLGPQIHQMGNLGEAVLCRDTTHQVSTFGARTSNRQLTTPSLTCVMNLATGVSS